VLEFVEIGSLTARSSPVLYILAEAFAGYGLGGPSITLLRHVGGGIYTKAADVAESHDGASLESREERQ
jgi:Na+/H+-translocating membrane pyrophosphatase